MVMSGWGTAVNSYMAELNIARAMFATSRHLLTPLAKTPTVPMTADQARQRATSLIEAADELDRLT
jgi:hypothetical protein